jgi:hypothetical protein
MESEHDSPRARRRTAITTALCSLVLIAGSLLGTFEPAYARKPPPGETPLSDRQLSAMNRAVRSMRSGKYAQATQTIEGALAEANDVSKCIAIAQYTEAYGNPMNEVRRACLNKAYSLATSREDLILVALKARQYQFFEITRQTVGSLIANARTIPELYDLARKTQEVALNDIAHLAMEKAYTGVKDQAGAFAFAEQAKAMGMDDLLRKVLKELIDDEDDVVALCDLLVRVEGYNMRDHMRYGLRKSLDKAQTVSEMSAIFEAATRLHEPDIANRANYFVRKGKIIQKIKEDRANYEAQLRGWREGLDLDGVRGSSAVGDSGFSGTSTSTFKKTTTTGGQPATSGF